MEARGVIMDLTPLIYHGIHEDGEGAMEGNNTDDGAGSRTNGSVRLLVQIHGISGRPRSIALD